MTMDEYEEQQAPYEQGMVRGSRHEIVWEAPEYIYQRKSRDWYWKMGIVAFGIAAAAYILHNILFGILIIIASFTVALFGAKQPETLRISISSKGVRVNNQLYPFSELDAFCILDRIIEPKILLQSKGLLHSLVSIPLGKADPDEIHEMLSQYLREEEMDESFTQRIIDKTGF